MPKVTEEYKAKKRIMILEAAVAVLKRKPLYELTMLDVVNEAKLSKGGIYLYFTDIDDLLIQMINYVMEEPQIDGLKEEKLTSDVEENLVTVFGQLGDYMEACPPIIGKIRSELIIYITNHPEKMDRIRPALTLQQTGNQFMEVTNRLIMQGMEEKVFRNNINLPVIMTNISLYLDGITEALVRSSLHQREPLQYAISEYLQQYMQSLIAYMK